MGTMNFFSFPLDQIREEQNQKIKEKNEEKSVSLSPENYKTASNNVCCSYYAYDANLNCLTALQTNCKYIDSVQFGLNDSCYTLSDEGRVIVSGCNKFDQLGIENEIIESLLRHLFDCSNRDIAYLISSFVDGIKYKKNYLCNDGAMLINNPLLDACYKISAGISSRHRFILTANNQLYGVGNNLFNQIGIDRKCIYDDIAKSADGNNKDRPLSEANIRKWTKVNFFNDNELILRQIECGYTVSTFLCQNGHIYTVGFSAFGNLGFGEKKNKTSQITKICTIKTRIESISCGFDHTLALNEYRYVLSFGDNCFGQLGHGHFVQNRRQKPKEIEYFRKHGVHATSVQCGAFHSVVLDCNGLVYCFGHNLEFQCHPNNDDAANLNVSLPRLCGALHNIVQMQQTNEWWLWGDNRNKQCLVYDAKTQFIKVPTKYHQNDIDKNSEYILDLFAGYNETRILTTK